MQNKFNENDKEKFIEFLNYIHTTAKWKEVGSQEQINYVKLLNHMQTQILPKIESHILEVLAVHEAEENKEE